MFVSIIDLDPATPVRKPARRAGVLSVIALVAMVGVTFAPVSTQPTQRIVINETTDQDGYRCEITVNGTTVYAEASGLAMPNCTWPR